MIVSRLIFFVGLFFSNLVFAQNNPLTIVGVGQAELEVEKISFNNIFYGEGLSIAQRQTLDSFIKVITNDFLFYKKYFSLDLENLKVGNDPGFGKVQINHWSRKKSRYLVHFKASPAASERTLKMEFLVFDVPKNKKILEQVRTVNLDDIRTSGHRVADDIYQSLKGKESIFTTKIVFVSDKGSSSKKPYKELFIMDFDGGNIRQLTNHKMTVLSPFLSSDGKQVLYSLIQEKNRQKNINLFLMDVETKTSTLLSDRLGMNSGAIFSKTPGKIIFTLSYQGSADIYEMDIATKSLRKITDHFAEEVDPSLSRSGNVLSFLSSRPGKAMIYTMDPSGTERSVKRIGFVGQFNATPRFSPTKDEITFASWLDNSFDIFRIGSDGNGLVRLTKDFGSNEDPTFSNDGEFIAFSSQRVLSRKKAVNNIYIMDRDGEILGNITTDFGNCTAPRWSN